ncbi:sensor domain-containing diguanylate cyclase [Agrobacterium tumefaciens]|uniref:GGDEF domain-containing protein n=1 Tax=Agrobacterium tumefaciens TaxID=358 RepID=UPI00157221C4|nr:GGDEF domain-containing protein [Agrobacterium tumefaciens]
MFRCLSELRELIERSRDQWAKLSARGQALKEPGENLSRKLSNHICLAIFFTAILTVIIVKTFYQDFSTSRQKLKDIQNYRLILDAANLFSAERGPSNIIMSEGPSPNRLSIKRLIEFRQRSDAALEQLFPDSEGQFVLHGESIPPKLLLPVLEQLALARIKVDNIAAAPHDTLTQDKFQDALESMFQVVDLFQLVVTWTANQLITHDADLGAPVIVGQMLGELREYGGRIASQIMAPIASKQPLSLQNLIDSRKSQGRLLELWKIVSGANALYGSPALTKSRNDVERFFIGEGLPLIEQLIEEGRQEAGYSLTATEFTNRFVPTLSPLEAYRTAFLDATVGNFFDAEKRALIILVGSVLVSGVILSILMTLIISMRIKIFGPLLRAHDEVVNLAEERPIERAEGARCGEMARLFHAIDVLQEKVRERAALTNDFKAQAETDALTGLFNRRMLDRVAQGRVDHLADEPICLILIDIDHFKKINDTHGHLAGDKVLVETADLLRSLLRSIDVVARFGGEEFAILVPGADLSQAVSLATKTQDALASHEFKSSSGDRIIVTASFGVACGRRGLEEWLQLAKSADTALYSAKSDGRNCVRFAHLSST